MLGYSVNSYKNVGLRGRDVTPFICYSEQPKSRTKSNFPSFEAIKSFIQLTWFWFSIVINWCAIILHPLYEYYCDDIIKVFSFNRVNIKEKYI